MRCFYARKEKNMTVDSPENKLTVSVENAEELKNLCDTAKSLMNTLQKVIKEIETFELAIKIE